MRVRPIEARIDSVGGRTLVAPIEIAPLGAPGASRDLDEPLTNRVLIQLEDGATTIGEIYRVTPRLREQEIAEAWLPMSRWWQVQPAGDFRVRDLQNQSLLAPGFWVLVTTPPPWAQRGDLRVSGARFVMQWHESWRAPRRIAPAAVALRPDDEAFLQMLRPSALDLVSRWRLRLLSDSRVNGAPAIGDLLGVSLGHHVLDAMELQLTDRWRVALSRLDEADQDLADSVFFALTRVAFDGSRVLPAWDTDEQRVAALLKDLLDPGLRRNARAARARHWLTESKMLVAWISDDSGLRTPDKSRLTVTTRLAWLGDRSTLARAENDATQGPEVLARPGAIVSAPVTIDERSGDPRLRVRAGGEVVELLALSAPQTAAPPGMRMGPLFSEWTLDTWRAGETRSAEQEWSTGALLYKEPARDDWTLYIECRTPVGFDFVVEPTDVVRVWLGRTGRSAAILRLTSEQRAYDEVTQRDFSGDVAFARRGDRWSAIIPVPRSAIDADGVLRIAIERIDPRGVRTTWPRPMLPWSPEPGRISADLTGWNEQRQTESR